MNCNLHIQSLEWMGQFKEEDVSSAEIPPLISVFICEDYVFGLTFPTGK